MKKFLLRYGDIPFFIGVILLIDLFFRKRMGFDLGLNLSLLLSLVYYVFFTGVVLLLKKQHRLIIEVVLSFVFALYVFAQTLHYAYFSVFFSVNKILLIQELSGVLNSTFGKISLKDVLYFIPPLMLGVVNVFLNRDKRTGNKLTKAMAIVFRALSVFGISNFKSIIPSDAHDWDSDMKYNFDNLSNKNKAVNDFGTMTYLHLDLIKTANYLFSEDDPEVKNEIQTFVENNHSELSSNEMTGIFEGMNLIMIQCESLSEIALTETIMPTVSKMAEQGIYFSNFYAPIYQSATADTEFISQTSLIPSIDGAPTAYAYQNNHYTGSLAMMMTKEGYSANSFHSYYRVFYNREQLHEAMGFSTYYAKDLLGIEYPEGYEDGINWPSDEELMWRMMKKVESTPFYHFVITATGHMPYVGYRAEYEGDYYYLSQILADESDEMLSYYASQSHLDRSIQTLMTILEEEGFLENTVVVLYGDHYPYGLSEENQSIYFADEIQRYQVPLVIYSGNHSFNMEIDKLCSTFDLLPTLANMFGLSTEDQFYFGNDIFSDEESVVYFYDRSWMSEDVYYDSTVSKTYDQSGVEITSDRETQMKINELFELSQKMLESDYYGE